MNKGIYKGISCADCGKKMDDISSFESHKCKLFNKALYQQFCALTLLISMCVFAFSLSFKHGWIILFLWFVAGMPFFDGFLKGVLK